MDFPSSLSGYRQLNVSRSASFWFSTHFRMVSYVLQKLGDEGEFELLDQVKTGNLSANAAMKKVGFR